MTLMGCHYFTVLSFKKSPSGIHKYRQRRVDFDIYKSNWRLSSAQVEAGASLAKQSPSVSFHDSFIRCINSNAHHSGLGE